MKLSNVINVVDTEWDVVNLSPDNNYKNKTNLIEVGVTTIDNSKRKIISRYSIPLYTNSVDPYITELTGWTASKLQKCGLSIPESYRRLQKLGFNNRLLVSDTNNEIDEIEYFYIQHLFHFLDKRVFVEDIRLSSNRLNIQHLFYLKTGIKEGIGLDKMLEYFGIPFEGKRHTGLYDSFNIAKLFMRLMYE